MDESNKDSRNMPLPERWNDPLLLEYEPLLSFYPMMRDATRAEVRLVKSGFVSAMQEDQHEKAAKAARKWILLILDRTDLYQNYETIKVLDDGEELYKTFFEFYFQLRDSKQNKTIEFRTRICKKGSRALKIDLPAPVVLLGDTPGESGKSAQASVATVPLRPGHADTESLSEGHHLAGSVSSPTATPEDRSTVTTLPRKKRAKSVSQRQHKPPVPRPSKKHKRNVRQASTDTSPACAVPTLQTNLGEAETPATPTSSRPKRLASNPERQQALILDLNAYEAGHAIVMQPGPNAFLPPVNAEKLRSTSAKKKQSRLATNARIAELEWRAVTSSSASKEGDKMKRNLPSCNERRWVYSKNAPNAGSIKRGGTKARRMDNRDLPTRSSKRQREASTDGRDNSEQQTELGMDDGRPSSVEGEGPTAGPAIPLSTSPSTPLPVEGTAPIQSSCVPTAEYPRSASVTRVASSIGDLHQKNKSRKRQRVEVETASAPPQMAEVHQSRLHAIGIREIQPLPRKTFAQRVPIMVGNETTDVRSHHRIGGSQEDVDRSLRDAATNALTVLNDGECLIMPDWTKDAEQEEADNDPLAADPSSAQEATDMQIGVQELGQDNVTFKPRAPTPPRIWAQSRQEVCESFEHFRSYQGGVYSHKDIVKGYLLGAYAASRDIFHDGGKLIISHGGGKAESVLASRTGVRLQSAQDQDATDTSVRALLKNYKERRPLVLLADDNYAAFPYDLAASGYTYVVLGIYWISYAWAEYQAAPRGQGRVIRWKFAFQWCDGQDDPWWWHQQEEPNTSVCSTNGLPEERCGPVNAIEQPSQAVKNLSMQCKSCLETSATVYMQGWMCLNPRCSHFWSISGKEPQQFDYHEEFLKPLPRQFKTLPNLLPTKAVQSPDMVTTTYPFSKGWHCTDCGRLSSRFKWEHWECANCHARHVVDGRVRLAKEFWHQRPPGGFLHSRIGKNSGIMACRPEPLDLGPAKGFTNRLTFILPHERGKIHLILGTPLANTDAHTTFQLYQQQASTGELQLRRYPLRNHKLRGLLLTNYFSQNSGEPYQYVGGTGNTVPFDEAPECVRRALAIIKERSSLAMSTVVPFNEILSAAYMERQKMSFHSDSEKGLGPVVASLSLGSTAVMHFRPHISLQEHKDMSQNALTLILRHGDVLIMEGDGVQKYYEHTVIPMNFRIAATARCIGST